MPKKELQNGFLFQDENMFVFATARKLPSVDMSARSMITMRAMYPPQGLVHGRQASIGSFVTPIRRTPCYAASTGGLASTTEVSICRSGMFQ